MIEVLASPVFNFPDLGETKSRVRTTPITFIIPPSTFLADERVFPFLGILKVAAEFRRNGNPVEVLDLSGYGNYEQIVDDYARSAEVRHFALTSTTPQIPAAARVVARLRENLPDASIALGGAHATLTHTGMSQDLMVGREGRGTIAFRQLEAIFDKIIVGDGEMANFYALDPDFRPQVVNAGDRRSPLFLKKGTLENFALPARDLIDMDSYRYEIAEDGRKYRAFSIIAQLGCPFECGFCGGRDSNIFRMARPRSPHHAVEEIEHVITQARERGTQYSGVMFYDDELNVSLGNLEKLCGELISLQHRLGLEMRFRGFVKAELFTRQQAELMYQAGFRILLSGIEAGSDLMLSAMKKHTSRDINSRLVNLAHDANLRVKALMSIGHPGESEQTISDSVEWILANLHPHWDDVDWTIITQYPGSPYFDRSLYDEERKAWKYSIKVGDQVEVLYSRGVNYLTEAEYYKGIPGEYEAYVWTDYLSSEQLVMMRDQAERVTRGALNLPPITAVSAMQFEHSMGQGLPTAILRRSY